MYRAVALAVLNEAIDQHDLSAVAQLVRGVTISFEKERLLLNELDVTSEIRSPEVTAISSVVASNPSVRERLVQLQREVGKHGSMVTEGRDQGTVVFPHAEHKFFVKATLESRAQRRQRELAAKGVDQPISVVMDQLHERDERDETREHAPLKPAENAVVVDTSDLAIAQVVEILLSQIQSSKS